MNRESPDLSKKRFIVRILEVHQVFVHGDEALDEALAGSAEALPEQFAQLDEFLAGRS